MTATPLPDPDPRPAAHDCRPTFQAAGPADRTSALLREKYQCSAWHAWHFCTSSSTHEPTSAWHSTPDATGWAHHSARNLMLWGHLSVTASTRVTPLHSRKHNIPGSTRHIWQPVFCAIPILCQHVGVWVWGYWGSTAMECKGRSRTCTAAAATGCIKT